MTQTDPFERARGRLGFGCMRLPRLEDGEIDIPQFSQMVDAFLAAGFNYFDTAHVYLEGKSEPAIRQALTSRHARDEYFLVDKLTNGNFNSTEQIVPLLEEELAACGVEYFDLLLMHAQSRESYAKYQRLGAYEEAYKLVRDGRVRHFGISFHDTAEVLDQILTEHPEVECVQLQLNYLDWDDVSVQSRACYEVCRAHGKPVMVMEPIKGGTLATLPPAAAEALAQTCPDAPASYALRFAGGHEGVAMVLSGMGTTEQMAQNIKTFSPLEPLSEKELAGLARVVNVMHGQDVVACTACRYCIEGCPRRIDIPALFACLNAKRAYGDRGQAFYYNNVHTKGRGRASDCVRCGRCEHTCPQHLPIRELLQDVAAEFEAPAE